MILRRSRLWRRLSAPSAGQGVSGSRSLWRSGGNPPERSDGDGVDMAGDIQSP